MPSCPHHIRMICASVHPFLCPSVHLFVRLSIPPIKIFCFQKFFFLKKKFVSKFFFYNFFHKIVFPNIFVSNIFFFRILFSKKIVFQKTFFSKISKVFPSHPPPGWMDRRTNHPYVVGARRHQPLWGPMPHLCPTIFTPLPRWGIGYQ